MPYSLKVKLGHLNYKGILTEQEYIRLINALDHEKILTVTDFADRCRECGTRYIRESVLEDIKAEFISLYPKNYAGEPELGGLSCKFSLNKALEIIDKYMTESEEQK